MKNKKIIHKKTMLSLTELHNDKLDEMATQEMIKRSEVARRAIDERHKRVIKKVK